MKTARENTLTYERVFRGKIDPTNHVISIDELRGWRVSILSLLYTTMYMKYIVII